MNDMLGLAVVGLAASFIVLCLYQEQKKRRKDEDYLMKAEARRFLERESYLEQLDEEPGTSTIDNPFLHNIQLGEAKILCGDIDAGIQNLTKAVFICDRPVKLLQVMQKILDEHVFAKLMLTVEETREEFEVSGKKFNDDLDKVTDLGILNETTHTSNQTIEYDLYEECF